MTIYAAHASDAFNRRMDAAVLLIGHDMRDLLGDNLVALVLGGGYGRGEGGVVRVDGREEPYNDLDFVLVVGSERKVDARRVAEIGERHARALGIHVDFSRPLTIRGVRAWPHWLMWTELLNGHMVVEGPGDVLAANAPTAVRGCPPAVEATRLLLNRGAGLLWAMRVRRGAEPAPDADFVRRNAMKCAQALGDAVAIAHGRHRTPYAGRDAVLAELERHEPSVASLAVGASYRAALAFRLDPGAARPEAFDEAELSELADRWATTLLHVEAVRTGRGCGSLAAYVANRDVRELEQNRPGRWPRNLVQNLRTGRLSLRYPRERLFRELPPLLAGARSPSEGWIRDSRAALQLWQRFN